MSEMYDRILEQTTRLGLTGKAFGSLLGLRKSPLTDWKNHKSAPTVEQLIKMCEIFAVSSEYLLFGKKNNFSTNENILLERFGMLNASEQSELLAYAEFKVSHNLKNTDNENSKTQGKYIPSDQEKSDNIIA